jgi:transposase
MGTSREQWTKRIERWRRSGLTAREFAKSEAINHHTLAHWAWRLGLKKSRQLAPSRKRPRRQGRATQSAFVEVMSHTIADGCFELELGGSRRLRIPPGFEAGALERLLAVLEVRP